MQTVREFLRGLPEPLRRCVEEPWRAHQAEFLSQLETFWRANGNDVLASLQPERDRLEALARKMGQQVRKAWSQVERTFLEDAYAFLEQAGAPSSADSSDCVRILGTREGEQHLIDDNETLEQYRRDGGAAVFAPGSRLREDIRTWIANRGRLIDAFMEQPLGKPAWQAIGSSESAGAARRATGLSHHGLRDTSTAPWVVGDANHSQIDPAGNRGSGQRSMSTYLVCWTICDDRWWNTLQTELPTKQIVAYEREQANSTWIAAQVLDLLLGDAWLGVAPGEDSRNRDGVVTEWFAAVDQPFSIWVAAASAGDAVGNPYTRLAARDHGAFARLRNEGRSMSGTAGPYALMVSFLTETIGAHTPGDSASTTAESDRPDAGGLVTFPTDESAYVSATKIVAEYYDTVATLRRLHGILSRNPWIRRWKPARSRLCVHLGDWRQYVDRQAAIALEKGGLAAVSELIERRTTAVRAASS